MEAKLYQKAVRRRMIVKFVNLDMNGILMSDVRNVQQENMNFPISAKLVLQVHGPMKDQCYRRPILMAVAQLMIILVNVYEGIITQAAVKNVQQVLTKNIKEM